MTWLIPAAAALLLLLVGIGFRRWLAQDDIRQWRRSRRQYQQPDNVRPLNRKPPSAA